MKYDCHPHSLLKTNEIRHSTNSVLTAAVGLVNCAVDVVVVGGGGGIVVVVVGIVVGAFDTVAAVETVVVGVVFGNVGNVLPNRLGKLQLGVLQQHPPMLPGPPKFSNV
jgi:hypothetical protein